MDNKTRYQLQVLRIKALLRNGLVIQAYEVADNIIKDMNEAEE